MQQIFVAIVRVRDRQDQMTSPLNVLRLRIKMYESQHQWIVPGIIKVVIHKKALQLLLLETAEMARGEVLFDNGMHKTEIPCISVWPWTLDEQVTVQNAYV